MKRCSIALAVLVWLPLLACAADAWPEFRGPTGQGHYKGELPTGKKVGGKAEFFIAAADVPIDPPAGWEPIVAYPGATICRPTS